MTLAEKSGPPREDGGAMSDQNAQDLRFFPSGCLCSYTWSYPGDGSAVPVRNGPVASCPADHSADGIPVVTTGTTAAPAVAVTEVQNACPDEDSHNWELYLPEGFIKCRTCGMEDTRP